MFRYYTLQIKYSSKPVGENLYLQRISQKTHVGHKIEEYISLLQRQQNVKVASQMSLSQNFSEIQALRLICYRLLIQLSFLKYVNGKYHGDGDGVGLSV